MVLALNNRRISYQTIFALAVIMLVAFSFSVLAAPEKVYVAPVTGVIDGGTYAFLERVYEEAEKEDKGIVLLEIDTPGGYIVYAQKIRDLIEHSTVKTIAFVDNNALSAGALIALISDELVMSPGATMGAAEPRIGNEKADPKIVSAWSKELKTAAELNGKNGDIAMAMADAKIEIEGLVGKGELLTLTAKEALEYELADAILANRREVLEQFGLQNAEIVEETPGAFEGIASWVSNPYISAILLTIGIAGLVIEIFTIGFGIPGGIGLIALGIYFFGSMFAGLSGYEAILLFVLGIILLVAEIFFIPGFGLAGIGGLIALILGVVMAAPSVEQAVTSLVAAIIGTVILLFLSIKFLPTRRVWSRLILSDKQEKDKYIAPTNTLVELIGASGETLTPLRPAGTAKINGKRIDVVTSGEFISKGTKIKFIKVEGPRVIVEEE